MSALMWTSRNGNCEISKFLLEKGAQVNLQNKKGLSALMHASQYKNLGIMELLLKNGARLDLLGG